MKKSIRTFIIVALAGSLTAGALIAKPIVKADRAATRILASLGGLKDAPRLHLVLRQAIRELDLTPEQVDAARDVLKSHYADVSAALAAVASARAELTSVIRSDPADDVALVSGADDVAAAQRDLVLATSLLRIDLRTILTDAQLDKLDALEARLAGRVGKVQGIVARWVESA